MTTETPSLIRAAQASHLPEFAFRHPLNANSEIYLRSLSALAGLQRLGLHLGRVPPGRESFVYHFDQARAARQHGDRSHWSRPHAVLRLRERGQLLYAVR